MHSRVQLQICPNTDDPVFLKREHVQGRHIGDAEVSNANIHVGTHIYIQILQYCFILFW
jgi:hypothetical protein